MEERVYRSKVRDVEDLRRCILQAWDELDHPSLLIKQSVNGVRDLVFVSMRLADNLNTNFDW